MPNISVIAYKGTRPDKDKREFQLDPMLKLSTVRDKLTGAEFLPADKKDETEFRFVATQSESTTFQDAVIPKSAERVVPLAGVLGNANQLICTNISARTKPDLIGIATDWFFNRYLGVKIHLNVNDPAAKQKNDEVKAFQPLMLTNVKPTSEKVVGIWDNVCVCVDGTVVSLELSSWGSAGFEMYVAQEQGAAILPGGLFLPNGGNPGYSRTVINRYRDKDQSIQIVSASSQGIGDGVAKLNFQKVTFKTRRMTSYKQGDGKVITNNQSPPTRSGPAGPEGYDAQLADAAADFGNQRGLANAKGGIDTVPGDSIVPGGPVEGPKSQQTWGGPISNIKCDDWTQALGEVVVYFFVFKTWEQANTVINGYNAPDPSLWS